MCDFCRDIEKRNPYESPTISFKHWDNGEIEVECEWSFCPVCGRHIEWNNEEEN